MEIEKNQERIIRKRFTNAKWYGREILKKVGRSTKRWIIRQRVKQQTLNRKLMMIGRRG